MCEIRAKRLQSHSKCPFRQHTGGDTVPFTPVDVGITERLLVWLSEHLLAVVYYKPISNAFTQWNASSF